MLRHAKSSWKHDVIDHQRPLKGRGNNDAKLLSDHLKDAIKAPQLIISSDANRALSTAQYFKEAFQVSDDNFTTNHELYDFSGQQVMKVINSIDDSLDRVMIVGHNHAFTSIANMLGSDYIDNMPTCGFVILRFKEDSWSKISTGKTKKTYFPRDFK
ncbi:MAG: phosphohistidine phosphatase [Flavobacteriaceae bacterium]|jgi:phosphohistidine phosphatase